MTRFKTTAKPSLLQIIAACLAMPWDMDHKEPGQRTYPITIDGVEYHIEIELTHTGHQPVLIGDDRSIAECQHFGWPHNGEFPIPTTEKSWTLFGKWIYVETVTNW